MMAQISSGKLSRPINLIGIEFPLNGACLCQDKSTWLRFFNDASVPADFVSVYANKFVENRIRFDMLGDLDRALLNEMGISAIGDSLSILKHAKIIMQKVRT